MFRINKILVILMIIVVIFFYSVPIAKADDKDEEDINENQIKDAIINASSNVAEEPKIFSKAAVIYDRTTGKIIWGKNENEKRAMASTTKIMTAIVIIEKANLKDIVTISKKAANTGGSVLHINTGDKISVNDLLYGLLLRSGNDTAVALAEHVGGSIQGFAKLMNQKAKELGLNCTNFVTPHGLDNENHYTTALELAKLTDYALKNEKFAQIVNTKKITISINGTPRAINNTNELLGVLNGVNGVKTGFTGNAGRCLVTSCTREENQIITVVLGADTKKQRTSDSTKLIEYAFANYERISLEEIVLQEFQEWKNINEKRIYVNKAKEKQMNLQMDEVKNKMLVIKKGEKDNIDVKFEYIPYFEAPVEENSTVGIITITKKDSKNIKKEDIIETVKIYNKDEISKKGIKEYFCELLSFYCI